MRFVHYANAAAPKGALAVQRGADLVAIDLKAAGMPEDLLGLIQAGNDALQAAGRLADKGRLLDPAGIRYLPPIPRPPKLFCVGLNYKTHIDEGSSKKTPEFPVIFARFASSLIGHNAPMIRPLCSIKFDYEGEMVAIVGKPGKHIPRSRAAEHIAGYAVFNDGSVRDFQLRTSQWIMGKNFDGSGPFGPCFVTADEVPPLGQGLKLETRLNGQTMQSTNTSDMVFGVGALVESLSEGLTLESGDLLITGTCGGVGQARTPPVWMKAGDVVEVEIEGLGILRNPVEDEKPQAAA